MNDIETMLTGLVQGGITKAQREHIEQIVWLIRNAQIVRKLQWVLAYAPQAQEAV